MRKILSFVMALVLSFTFANAETVRLYCKVTQSWWTADNAAVAIHCWGGTGATTWPGVRMTAVEGENGVWYADLDKSNTEFMFVRVNGSGDIADWGAKTANLTLPEDDKDLYTITSTEAVWGDPGVTGEWSKYVPAENPEPSDVKFYVTGDAALVGQDLAWHPDAIAVKADSYTFKDLAAGDYKLKVTLDGTWATAKGFDDLTVQNDAFTKDNDGNIVFSLEEAGDVVVTCTSEVFKVEGKFKGATVDPQPSDVKFYVTGDAALVGQDLAWHPDAIAVKADSYTFEALAAGDYKLKVTLDGTWATAKGFDDLTVQNDAFTKDNDGNIVFSLEEAGDVVVTCTSDVFKVEGKFKGATVDPQPSDVKFYVTGDAALVGEDLAWKPNAIAVKADSYTFENLAAGEYKLKITIDGTWDTGRGFGSLTVQNDAFTKDDDDNIIFSLEEAGDVVVTYTSEVFKVEGKFKAAEDPGEEHSYTIYGTFNDWKWEARVAMPNGVVEIPLEANAECLFKVVVDDSSEGQLGFDAVDLECSSKGVELSDEEWRNVKVTMAEAGNLRVEVVEGKLCVTGKFVAPQEEQHSYTIYGTFNDWNWEARVAMPNGVVEIPLEANAECLFKVVVDDSSEGQLGFDAVDLECSSKGVELSDEEWRNVKVTMAEAGNLRVEVVEGKLCVTGNFVAPEEPDVDYFLVGSAEAIGAWGGEGAVKFVNGVATATLPAGVCEFKVVSEGESDWDWDHSLGFAAVDAECSSKGISEGDNGNVKIEMAAEGELKVEIKNGKLCVTGNFVDPEAGDGIFLVGNFNEWTCKDAYKFAANPGAEGEFVLQTTLAENDELKIKVVEGESETWYPAGDNYVVDAAHAGNVIIYFRPVENEDWADKNFFIQVQGGTGVENTAAEMKAQKFIENGQLFIIVNTRVFNVTGQIVR